MISAVFSALGAAVKVGIGAVKLGVKAIRVGVKMGKTLVRIGKKAKRASSRLGNQVVKAVNASRQLTAVIDKTRSQRPMTTVSNIFNTAKDMVTKSPATATAGNSTTQSISSNASVAAKIAEIARLSAEVGAETQQANAKEASSEKIVKSRIFTKPD